MAVIQKSENTAITIKGRTENSDAYTEQMAYSAVQLDFLRTLEEFAVGQEATVSALITALDNSNMGILRNLAIFIQLQYSKADSLVTGTQAIAGLMRGTYLTTTFKTEGTIGS